jgi:hypothetical protein
MLRERQPLMWRMKMNFDEFYKDITEYKADHSSCLRTILLSAWKAGALTMFDRLLDLSDFEEGLKELIRAKVDALVEGKE